MVVIYELGNAIVFHIGGYEIQKECNEYIKVNGQLLAGQFYTSKAGRLPCHAVIHAVGPMWQKGERNEENILFETVYNVLEHAEKSSFSSIAMPAISTGVYGFPLNKACKAILDGIEEFVIREKPMILTEVHLIDMSRKVTNQLHETATNQFQMDLINILEKDDDDDSDNRSRSASPLRRWRGVQLLLNLKLVILFKFNKHRFKIVVHICLILL